jgi:hypothetical protein
MFSYYGSKSKIVDCYPKPKYGKIIEPFAGSARYSLKWFDRDVLLVDKYDVIVKIWKWLQVCSPQDILRLPTPKLRETIERNQFENEEAFLLMSFVIKSGSATPGYTVCKNRGEERQIEQIKKDIAENLFKIRHWKIQNDDYRNISNDNATWFIDPPYQVGGKYYKHGSKELNFGELAEWCKTREGQVIVCENTKANWLPFKPMKEMYGTMYETTEAIWSNQRTNYDDEQENLFATVALQNVK